MSDRDVVILRGARTPFGTFGGSWDWRATEPMSTAAPLPWATRWWRRGPAWP